MPTYKFKCPRCKRQWTEVQPVDFDKPEHTSTCSGCQNVYTSVSFGGTGTQLKGRHMNKYLEGFPDQTNRLNSEAERDAKQMERDHDAYHAEQLREDD